MYRQIHETHMVNSLLRIWEELQIRERELVTLPGKWKCALGLTEYPSLEFSFSSWSYISMSVVPNSNGHSDTHRHLAARCECVSLRKE